MQDFSIEIRCRHFTVSGSEMTITFRERGLARLDLAPVLEGHKTELSEWTEEANAYSAQLVGEGRVFLEPRDGRLAYWVESPIAQFESLVYFPETDFEGDRWRTFLPDGYDPSPGHGVPAKPPTASPAHQRKCALKPLGPVHAESRGPVPVC